MREAVIVSTARTGIGKAFRGSFNNTEAPSLTAPAIREAVKRAKLDPAEVEDVIMGVGLAQGTQEINVARCCALAGGLPVTTSGMTLNRQNATAQVRPGRDPEFCLMSSASGSVRPALPISRMS